MLYVDESPHTRLVRLIPLQSARLTKLSAIVAECDSFIHLLFICYLFIYSCIQLFILESFDQHCRPPLIEDNIQTLENNIIEKHTELM